MSSITLLYGSRARGDADALSDEDVMTVGDPEVEPAPTYTWDEIERMRAYGSLFLQHLKLESRVLSGDRHGQERWRTLIAALPAYQRTAQDLRSFEAVANDILDALATGDSPTTYEASVAARLVRHLAILACYQMGAPNFSRYAAVSQAANHYGVPLPLQLPYAQLYKSVAEPAEARVSVAGVSEWVHFARALSAAVARDVGKDNAHGFA